MSKLMLAAAGAVGYVFGARAGKERYTEIKSKATQMWQNPKVQAKRDQAQGLVKDKAPLVQEKIGSAASSAAGRGKRAAGRPDSNDSDDRDGGLDSGTDTFAGADTPVQEFDGLVEPTPMADGISATTDDTRG